MRKTKTSLRGRFHGVSVSPRRAAARLISTGRALALIAMLAAPGAAQVKPNATWRTFRTEHFSVTFTPEVEELARRTAARAEEAYAALSVHLRPPRGPIDIVVSDAVDYTNGFSTPFPTNRITLYANPPITTGSLRFVDDPSQMIVAHELVHAFQIDNSGGIWKVLQKVFGRSPYLFPNAFQPSWLTEGLAVHYETELTGSGRLAGSEHRMIARTAAVAHAFPRLDQISLARPHFPYGYSTYAYGSLFVEHMARTYGDSSLRTFVESSARQLIPLLLNPPARRAFGKRITAEYSSWARSLVDSAPPSQPPMPGWRDLTVEGAYANFPRWLNDSTLVYTGTPGKESFGAYQLRFTPYVGRSTSDVERQTSDVERRQDVERKRVARRHTESPNSVLSDGSLLYSQLEFTSPYEMRSDLYLDRRRGGTTRLTHGARLAIPDARSDGLIVAVQTVPAGTRLALVSADGKRITPITGGGLDEQWLEPRWSPDGRHIAAIRWTIGGTAEVVVLDTAGSVEASLLRERAIAATPSWSSDGRFVYFSSDRTGTTNLYRAPFVPAFGDTTMVPSLQRMSDAQTGLFEPQPSPGGRAISAVVFRTDGYHIGVAPFDSLLAEDAPALASVSPRPAGPRTTIPALAKPYSPWRSLLPRYWIPFSEPALEENSARLGAYTSGEDLVARHAYRALLFVPTDNSGITGSLYYRNARLGQPLVEVVAEQEWENYRAILDAAQQNRQVGMLRRRIRDATLSLTFQRPRARTYSYFSVGGGWEVRDYAADSTPLMARIDSVYGREFRYPRATLSLGWSNTQYPTLAISAEDGVALSSTGRIRWRLQDTTAATVSVVGAASAFKSLALPGFAHHVAALRATGGYSDSRGTGYLEVGGVSGGTLDVLPGYSLGEGRRTFGVRGFPAATLVGIRAFAGSIEYRAPLTLPGRGLGSLPLFLDRTSVTVFGDAGSAWCPGVYPTRRAPATSLCTQSEYDIGRTTATGYLPLIYLEPKVIGSAGAELNVSAAILSWDVPFRYRLGFAVPAVGRALTTDAKASAYFTVGVSF